MTAANTKPTVSDGVADCPSADFLESIIFRVGPEFPGQRDAEPGITEIVECAELNIGRKAIVSTNDTDMESSRIAVDIYFEEITWCEEFDHYFGHSPVFAS
ncbi:hypothetical protein ACV229_23890 [Burkholderia sp. MR1-5-21]